MERTITVRGTGSVSVRPDLIVITLTIGSQEFEYDDTMQTAAESVEILQHAIESVGFDKNDLKTTSFNIKTHYENYRDKDNNYKSRFDGYICEQGLKLEFGFDNKVMSKILAAIARAPVNPQLNVAFSVKDQAAIGEALLISATENARQRAEILARASGVVLGPLLSIDYNWGELHLYSPTSYCLDENCMKVADISAPDIQPDDIKVQDTVTFIWQIA